MRRLTIVPFLVALSLFASPTRARASLILFTDLGAGGTYDQNNGLTITGSNLIEVDAFTQGSSFVPAQTATLDVIEAALTNASGPNEVDFPSGPTRAGCREASLKVSTSRIFPCSDQQVPRCKWPTRCCIHC
jgi:hypothetical protein